MSKLILQISGIFLMMYLFMSLIFWEPNMRLWDIDIRATYVGLSITLSCFVFLEYLDSKSPKFIDIDRKFFSKRER